MILVSDKSYLSDEMNVDDKLGERIDIPTIIVKKEDGEIIKRYIKNNPLQKVILSVKFASFKEIGNVNVDLYMRSDDIKSLHFFKEFRSYYEKLSKEIIKIESKITFRPIFKYYKYSWSGSSNELSTSISAGCIKDGQYCGTDNECNIKLHSARYY